uniref:Reverse transcriptase domain-containing protein n=1 Tax=Trichogramma kaykai TaxID=54128 RepID=A0ABD2WXY4_9HYME
MPTARTAPLQDVCCAWRSRPASAGAGDSFATRSTVTYGANHTGLPCHACDARGPGSLAPLSWFHGALAALFPRVPSGPAFQLPRRAGELVPAVTLEDLKGAQSRIKELSAPGPDGVPNMALKLAVAVRPDIFLRVYTMCLETGVFPSSWKRQRLVLLPKPGKPPDEPSSYRPLCILDTAGKILERIICDRLKAFTERPGGLSERQYCFRKGRSTIDAIEDVT